ncbi:MAG: alpha/beta fold hydrolase [Thermoleophilia bacterium]
MPGPWRSIGARLDEVARALPDRVALRSAGRTITYADLLRRATDRARALRRHMAAEPPSRPVALDIRSDADCVVSFLAIVLSGRPAVPLDPMLPEARTAAIVEAGGALRLDVDRLESLPAAPDEALPEADLDDPAVIFFTSGSTGTPKGVVHPHAAWLNQAYTARASLDLGPADCNALILPMSFGGGLDIVFMSLLTGGEMLVHDPRLLGLPALVETLRAPGVTTLHTTPSLLRSLLDGLAPGEVLPGVRVVTTCGEAVHSSLIERLRTHCEPDADYLGWSGASEIGTLAYFRLPAGAPVPAGIIPVGRPAANKVVEVLDDRGRPLGPGHTGEVAVTSRYLSLGYHDNAELTAERFTRNDDGTTTYRGGDLGRWDDDGVLHLRGRADAALKVGGYLVEPAEVEGALLDTPGVREAVVSGHRSVAPDGTARVQLVAHVVPAAAELALTPASLRRSLRDRLPTWMVPTHVLMHEALPRNERGKTAREALPAPAGAAGSAAPRTPTELIVADIWRDVLGVSEVWADADFWEMGADSLSVEELMAGVEQATGADLSSADLIEAPTIAALAALIDGREAAVADLPATAVRLRAGSAAPPVLAFAGGGAGALSLQPIAAALAVDVPFHAFHASGYAARALPDWSLRAVVRRHLAVIRRVAPEGPRVLVGHSFGGLLALETAAILAAEGVEVPLVVLLDTVLPDPVVAGAAPGAAPAERRPAAIPPLRERLRMHARLLGAGLVRYPPAVRDAVFWEQSLRMINRHRLTTWGGRTIVFTAPENPDDPAMWGRVLTGPHEVVPIDGGHSSILRPPFNRPIVDRLDAELSAMGA